MTTTIIQTMTLADCQCDGHERMRGRAAFLGEIITKREIFARWAAGVPDQEIDSMRRGLQGRRLRAELAHTAG